MSRFDQKVEYDVRPVLVDKGNSGIQDQLNEMARMGWRLHSIVLVPEEYPAAIFERESAKA